MNLYNLLQVADSMKKGFSRELILYIQNCSGNIHWIFWSN